MTYIRPQRVFKNVKCHMCIYIYIYIYNYKIGKVIWRFKQKNLNKTFKKKKKKIKKTSGANICYLNQKSKLLHLSELLKYSIKALITEKFIAKLNLTVFNRVL